MSRVEGRRSDFEFGIDPSVPIEAAAAWAEEHAVQIVDWMRDLGTLPARFYGNKSGPDESTPVESRAGGRHNPESPAAPSTFPPQERLGGSSHAGIGGGRSTGSATPV